MRLEDDTFDELVLENQSRKWFVKFYAPVYMDIQYELQWCGHCKQLEPTWEALSNTVIDNVNFAEVDGTEEKVLMSRFHIEGFPTLLFFFDVCQLQFLKMKGKYVEFKGKRTMDALKAFAEEGYTSFLI